MSETAHIILKSGKDQSLMRYHPWVFSGAIKKTKGSFEEGDVVKVYNNKDQFLGLGHYQPGTIAVRIISFVDRPVDRSFWREKFRQAVDLREKLGLTNSRQTNVYRLINAEGDGLPGLVVDYYNGTAVMQSHSVGMYMLRETFAGLLQEIMGKRLQSVYNKSAATLPHKADVERQDGYLLGGAHEQTVKENGLSFRINWSEGQKTGFYVDQRENRRLVQTYAQDADVLNLFGYTGGFSVYAAAGGCRSVVSLDSSRLASEMAEENMKLNFGDRISHEVITRDAFEYLREGDRQFDLVVVDPPAFAKHYNVLPNAIQGYKKLNRLAIGKTRPGGIIFTFSCSQVMSRENFRKMAFTASANTGRQVRILGQMSQPPDHPVSIYHPEGEYLKGLVLQVLD